MSNTLDFYSDLSGVMSNWGVDMKFLHPFYAYTKAYNKIVSLLDEEESGMTEIARTLYDIIKDVDFVRVVKTKRQFNSVSGSTVKIDKNLLMRIYSYGSEDKPRIVLTLEDWYNGENIPDDTIPLGTDQNYDSYSVCWFKSSEDLDEFSKHIHVITRSEDYIIYSTNVGKSTLRFAVVQETKNPPKDLYSTLDDAFDETSVF